MPSDSSPHLSISDELPHHTDAVLRVVNGFAASQALFNADELNVFNLIDEGTCDLAALSEATGIAPGPLERMLIVCCVVGTNYGDILPGRGGRSNLGRVVG